MEPIKLKLSGFKGIASGRGKNSIEIDFSKIDSGARMVALVGPNGAGKTTIMDNMHPYRVMPSRASSPTPTAYSFYDDLVEGADALKDLTWSHNGITYQSVVRMRLAGKTKKQECYLFVIGTDGKPVPYSDSTGLISDGKADSYDRCVEAICGQPEVFFAALFSAQGKRPISAMKVSEVKTLLASMLNLESVKTLSERAQEVVKGLRPHLDATKGRALPLQQQLMREPQVRAMLQSLNVTAATQAVANALEAERTAHAEVVRMESAAGQQESVKAQHAALTAQLESSAANLRTAKAELKARQEKERAYLESSMTDLLQTANAARKVQDEANLALASVKALVATEQNVRDAEAKRAALRDKLSAKRAQLDDLRVDAERLAVLRGAVNDLTSALATGKANGQALVDMVKASEQTASLINDVPCKGHAFQSACKLLSQANKAAGWLPEGRTQVVVLRNKYAEDRKKRDTATAELARLIEAETKHRALSEEIAKLTEDLATARTMAAGLPAVEEAKAKIAPCTVRVGEASAEVERIGQRQKEVQARLADMDKAHAEALSRLSETMAMEFKRVQTMIDALPRIVGEADLKSVRDQLAACEMRHRESRDRLDEIHAKRQECTLVLGQLDVDRESLGKIAAMSTAISDEIAGWTLLASSLGNNGIIAMSIDDAGPTLSSVCNSLLEDCYGGRFQVRLSTQQATATGVLKEGFDVWVEDSYRGEEKRLSDMSGGEKVWINECLVRAMALYIAQSSNQHHSTLFCDEADGPLDETRKRQFMSMKRSVLDRGGYKREYLVTQTPQLWDLCDARIDVASL
ncbi:MAG: DNA repair ATPase [Burkholderiaceae bacterium]|nr:MAG: DNA repair ATPase [Burkholderiaceae bacterium]